MGINDIQVVPIPRKQLKAWWNGMTEVNREYVRERVGYLLQLIEIDHQIDLIKAIARCWNVDTSSFMLNGHELVPTLEEYNAAIGVDFLPRLVEPPVGHEPASVLAEYLTLDLSKVKTILKSNMGCFPLQFLVDRYSNLPEKMGNTSARVFLLVFFGFVLFPCSRTALDPVVACIARQACFRWDYSNMLLAETVLSLNKYRRERKNIFLKGSAGLLSMWFFSHLQDYKRHMFIIEIDQSTHPLRRFFRIHREIRKRSFHDWTKFLDELTPEQLQWRAPWLQSHEVRLTSTEGNMIPLLGFNGGTAYCPLRMVRQFGMIQAIPPLWTPEPFSFELPHQAMEGVEKKHFQRKIDKITRALKASPKQTVTRPDEMEGEMKLYCATPEYIEHVRERRRFEEELANPLPAAPLEELYLPEYIEPYIPEMVIPPQEEDVRDEDMNRLMEVEVPPASKRVRLG